MTPTSKTAAFLTFDEVREAIGCGPARDRIDALLEECFHYICASVLYPEGTCYWARVLGQDELADHTKLASHVYQHALGPQLSSLQAALQDSAEPVLRLWKSVETLCRWLCGELETASSTGLLRYDGTSDHWTEVQFRTRPARVGEMSEPGRHRSLSIHGGPETLWQTFAGEWCVIAYGAGSNGGAIYAALCLELVLPADGIRFVRFRPEIVNRFYTVSELADSRKYLCGVVARLAAVQGSPVVKEDEDEVAAGLKAAMADCGAAGVIGPVLTAPAFRRYVCEMDSPADPARLSNAIERRLQEQGPPFVQSTGSRVVIDLPRSDRQVVLFASIEPRLPGSPSGGAWVPVGIDSEGRLRCANLAEAVHANILVSGTAQSGKTEWLRSAIAGLMARNTPDTLRLLLIDPTRAAFPELRNSPFLLTPPVVPPEQSLAEVLEVLADEMDDRFRQMAPAVTFDQYVVKTGEKLPRIVCICDEFASMDQTGKRVVTNVARLGHRARLAGIHLVFATRYPTRDVLGAAFSTYFACRVASKAGSSVESRMAILADGAEKLLGAGDLLFRDGLRPVRVQGVLTHSEDFSRIQGRFQPAADESGLVK